MKRFVICVFLFAMTTGLTVFAGNYDGFKVAVYTRAYEVEKMNLYVMTIPENFGNLAKEGVDKITDLLSGTVIDKMPKDNTPNTFRYRFRIDDKNNVFEVTLPPHSYRLFSK